MPLKNQNPTKTNAWNKLQKDYQDLKNVEMKSIFLGDPDRREKYTLLFNDLTLDFSKNRINDRAFQNLIELANEVDLKDGIDKMFSGDVINTTENRAVLHTALRNKSKKAVLVEGRNVMPEVEASLKKMEDFSRNVISGEFKGFTGKAITDVVKYGIGGSDLGPKMVVDALQYYKNHLKTHFHFNIDGDHVTETFKKI